MNNPYSEKTQTFNAAQLYAEQVLQGLVNNHMKARLRSQWGAEEFEDAAKFSKQERVWNRFNAMKRRVSILQTLIIEIRATVKLNKDKKEISYLKDALEALYLIEESLHEEPADYVGGKGVATRIKKDFISVHKDLDEVYSEVQEIMTKNNLLFQGGETEYLKQDELMGILREQNRSS